MADNRWSEGGRDWRDERGWDESRGRNGAGRGGRGYSEEREPRERWRRMHGEPRREGPAGYNDSGPAQGGWEFGDEAQGGYRGQGYERYGYGGGERGGRGGRQRGEAERYAEPGRGYYDEFGRDPGSGQGDNQRREARDYERGYQPGPYAGQGGYGIGAEDDREGRGRYAYGAHTPYGYRGRNEYDERGGGARYAQPGRREHEDRSWIERAGEKVADFFGAEDEGRHRGRGPRGYRRSDDRISEDVSDRLTDDPWLDASGIEVEVKSCEVILKGEVESRDDKRRAENLAESISGVRNVQNHLRLKGTESSESETTTARRTNEQTTTGRSATTQ